jgi:prepilin signal peptidase PulO-like enzyme (type II secretory pathway)
MGIGLFLLAFFASRRRLGLADVWYSGLIGMVLGPLWWYPAVFAACASVALVVIYLRKPAIPFIPCMALGSLVTVVLKDLCL